LVLARYEHASGEFAVSQATEACKASAQQAGRTWLRSPGGILTASLMAGAAAAARAAMVGLGNQDCGTWTTNNPAKGGVGLFY
jgi:hypothetical protein